MRGLMAKQIIAGAVANFAKRLNVAPQPLSRAAPAKVG